ncbi:EamA family transporter [bacterium]|nr:EamA family transporter [bacterium]
MQTVSWQLWAILSAIFAALTAIFGKIGVTGVNSNLATLLRTIVIVVFIGALVAFRGEWQSPLTLSRRCLVFLVLSALATGVSWLCYYRALQLGPASRVAPIDKLSVAFAIVLAVVFLHEKLSWQAAVGGVLVTAGALVLALAP